MAISRASGIAQSGMDAASRRLENVARNVANLQTAGYKPQRIVTRELPQGGVTTEAVPAEIPEDPWLDNPALGAASHVDLAFETVERITRTFPHWFSPTFAEFGNGREAKLPVDQHLLVALIAPRPLIETVGQQDHWANYPSSLRGLRAA